MSTKISQLTSATDVTANDLIQIVDVEDGVMAPSGTNKKATASLLAKELAKQPLEPGVVISGSSSGDAVRITQTGSGNALVVEDSANPDASPFAVSGDGRVGVGTNSPQGKLDIRDGTLRLSTDNNKTAVYGINRGDTSSVQGMASIGMFGSGTNGFLGNITFRTAESDTFDAMPSERMRISSDGNVGIGASNPNAKLNVVDNSANDAVRITQTGSGNALVVEDSTNPDSTPFVVDSNGRVVIGDVASRTGPYGFQRGLQITNTSAQLTFASDDQFGNAITFAKSRGTPSSPDVAVQSGDVLGSIAFTANDGSGYVLGSQITSSIDGTAGSGDIPSCLTFGTSADGTTGLVERMRITSAGNVGIGTNSPGAGTKLDVVGTIRSNELVVQNTSGPARIEVGGEGNVYIDLKKPSSDDYDLRIGTDSNTSSIDTASGQVLVLQQYGDNIGIGTASIESNCLLKLESTTKGFRPPSMTTTQRNAIATPIAGLMIYNNTTNKLNFYNGSAWEAVTSSV